MNWEDARFAWLEVYRWLGKAFVRKEPSAEGRELSRTSHMFSLFVTKSARKLY